MNSIFQALVLGEQIADRHGDPFWFKDDYTRLRGYNGILASMEGALKNQNLWGIFVSACSQEWLEKWFPGEAVAVARAERWEEDQRIYSEFG